MLIFSDGLVVGVRATVEGTSCSSCAGSGGLPFNTLRALRDGCDGLYQSESWDGK